MSQIEFNELLDEFKDIPAKVIIESFETVLKENPHKIKEVLSNVFAVGEHLGRNYACDKFEQAMDTWIQMEEEKEIELENTKQFEKALFSALEVIK